MWNSQVYIWSLVLHKHVLPWVPWKSTEAFQREAMPALQVQLPTALVTASNPDPAVGVECITSEKISDKLKPY
jgi:hypothetical protein